MTIEGVNLIPLPRRMAHRQRTRTIRWAVICGGYGAAALAIAPALSNASAAARALETQQHRLERDIAAVTEASTSLARQRQDLLRRSRLTQELAGSADWGRLLAAVAATIGADAALERLTLAPRDDAPGYLLSITGLAVSQKAVTHTALQLEQLAVENEPMFAAVMIQESRRRAIGSTPAVAFTIECTLAEKRLQAPVEDEK